MGLAAAVAAAHHAQQEQHDHRADDGADDPAEVELLVVADALAKAKRYATAAGVRLGELISIEEGGGYPPPRPMMRAEAMAADVPIAPGQTELSASVTITFALD